jgi:hypothetical protein
MEELFNSELTLELVPLPDADLDSLCDFASSFNGYKYWGSFEKCAEIANAGRRDSLTNVRTCLFFEVRRWRHYGDDPDAEAQEQWRELISEARRFIRKRGLEALLT